MSQAIKNLSYKLHRLKTSLNLTCSYPNLKSLVANAWAHSKTSIYKIEPYFSLSLKKSHIGYALKKKKAYEGYVWKVHCYPSMLSQDFPFPYYLDKILQTRFYLEYNVSNTIPNFISEVLPCFSNIQTQVAKKIFSFSFFLHRKIPLENSWNPPFLFSSSLYAWQMQIRANKMHKIKLCSVVEFTLGRHKG